MSDQSRLWLNETRKPCRIGLLVSVSASQTVGCRFASRSGHTKDHKIVQTASLHGT